MADSAGGSGAAGTALDVANDSKFFKLVTFKTDIDQFNSLVDTNLYGYSQKKLVADALKELLKKVEEAELKESYAKNLGKRKGLEEHEQQLITLYKVADLKEKQRILNAQLQAMLDEGKITHEEKFQVVDNLKARFEAAKTANKEKLMEKLQGSLQSVSKAGPFALDVNNLKEISVLHRQLEAIQAMEKRPAKSLVPSEKEAMARRPEVQEALRSLEERSMMWFESAISFKARLLKALEALAIAEADQRRREEEEAFERQRREEEEALEQRRLEAAAKEEAKHKQMLAKLEAKRLEDLAKPQKPVAAPKAKEKKKAKRLDPNSLFVHQRNTLADVEAREHAQHPDEEGEDWVEAEPEDEQDDAASQEPPADTDTAVAPAAETQRPSAAAAATPAGAAAAASTAKASAGYPTPAKAPAVSPSMAPAPVPAAPPQASAEKAPAEKVQEGKAPAAAPVKKEKVVLENKWAVADLPRPSPPAAEEVADEEARLSDSELPTLAEATSSATASTVKKTAPPPPKKKTDKKKFTKVSAVDLGWDAQNPNYSH